MKRLSGVGVGVTGGKVGVGGTIGVVVGRSVGLMIERTVGLAGGAVGVVGSLPQAVKIAAANHRHEIKIARRDKVLICLCSIVRKSWRL